VPVRSGEADEDTTPAELVDDPARSLACWSSCGAILYELDAEQQALSADRADERMVLCERLQRALESGADEHRVRAQAFLFHDVEYGAADRTRDWVARKSIEITILGVERVDDVVSRDNCADRVSVAHRLTQHDDVRLQAETVERPHMRAATTEASLHFVCDN
jgi:hypothetical protein